MGGLWRRWGRRRRGFRRFLRNAAHDQIVERVIGIAVVVAHIDDEIIVVLLRLTGARVVAQILVWLVRRQHRLFVRDFDCGVLVDNDAGLAVDQNDLAGIVHDRDGAVADCHDGATAIELDQVFGAADANGRDRGVDPIGALVAVTDGAGDGAQATTEQAEEAALAAVFGASVVIVVDLEGRTRLQRDQAAVGELELHSALLSDDGVARIDLATLGRRVAGATRVLH